VKPNVSATDLRMLVMSRLNEFKKNDKYNGIIRIIADPQFLFLCYKAIKSHPGNMTKGTTSSTLDGINWNYFENLAADKLKGKFRFSPVRRILIPKLGKPGLRALGIGSPREKIVQKALSILLECLFEPSFLDCSYGFRPKRSINQPLKKLYLFGKNYHWIVQGNISKCFDEISHPLVMELLGKVISCDRTLSKIAQHLAAGYIDPDSNQLIKSKIGTPQGSILSP